MKLAKGGQFKDQEWGVHASITTQIAEMLSELRGFSEINKKLLKYSCCWHDIGKKIIDTYKGEHKLTFETCFNELKKESPELDEDILKIVTHIILRHHFTSKRDIEELEKIYIPPNINIDVVLRNLRACDWLASMDHINLVELDKIASQIKPLKLFAYTISREGILAGKMMDIVDDIITQKGGKGIYYHNGSVFLLQEDLDVPALKSELKKKINKFLVKIFGDIIGIESNPMRVIIAPINELNSQNFDIVWARCLEIFDRKLRQVKSEEDKQKTYAWIQKAIFEIFRHFENYYLPSYDMKNKKFVIYDSNEVLKPILRYIDQKISPEKIKGKFDDLDYSDFEIIGGIIKGYLKRLETEKPQLFQNSLSSKGLLSKTEEMMMSSLTFLGDKPENVEEFARNWYEDYVKIAEEKGIGKEDQEEFCFICGMPATFSFKAAIAQKIKISKIFSNRRPALAKGIDTVKICHLCLVELKFLDSKLSQNADRTVFLYIERPITIKPPYEEIKEKFLDQLGYMEPGTPIYKEEFENIIYAKNLFLEESEVKYSIATNHFYVIFGDFPRNSGIQETMLYLLPFLCSLVKQTGFSVRVDVASNMDYKPVYRLLEVPPLAEEFTATDFEEPNGKLYKNYVLPVKIWLRLEIGNIIDFVKRFPTEWPHFFAKVAQNTRYKKFRKDVQEMYPKIKEVYV